MDEREHNIAPKVINGRFASGYSGNPGGSPEATRRAFNKRFLLDLAEDWEQHGREVFKRVRREAPAAYLKVCAILVPKEMKVEHSAAIKSMTDEELEQAIAALKVIIAAQASEGATVIDGTAESAALSAATEPEHLQRKRPNRLLKHVDTAIGPSERSKCKSQ